MVGKTLALVPKVPAAFQRLRLHWHESHLPNHSQRRHTEAVVADAIVVAAVFSVKLVPAGNIVAAVVVKLVPVVALTLVPAGNIVAAAVVKLVSVVALKLVLAANVVVSFAAISPQTTGNK